MGKEPKSESVRVFIAESSLMARQLMTQAFAGDTISVVDSPSEADVAIISVDSGFNLLRDTRTSHPALRTIVLVNSPHRDVVIECFRAGADGMFCRDQPFEMLLRCVHAVCDGQIWASSEQLRFLISEIAKSEPRPIRDATGTKLLTKREMDLAHLVAEGLTNREISRQLHLTEHTVRNYMFRIFNKLGLSNRLELALYVIKHERV